jgi:hypothetical protein
MFSPYFAELCWMELVSASIDSNFRFLSWESCQAFGISRSVNYWINKFLRFDFSHSLSHLHP